MESLSYHLTTTVASMRPTRIIAWRGSQALVPAFALFALIRVIVWSWRQPIEAIHVGDVLLAPLGLLLRLLAGKPVVVTAHGLDVSYSQPIYQAVTRHCLPRLDHVICISEYARQLCQERGVDRSRTSVIPVGISHESFRVSLPESERAEWLRRWGIMPEQRHIILGVGRMVPRKGFAVLVSTILPLLRERRDDWVCLLIGDGPDRSRVEREVKRHQLGPSVKVLGRVSQEELVAAYAVADVFVMPNVEIAGDGEGFGLVTLEARASGLPVVAYGLQGIAESLESADGEIVVSPGDIEGFVDAIDRLLIAGSSLEERTARRQRVTYRYGWTRIAREYLEVIDRLGARTGRAMDLPSK